MNATEIAAMMGQLAPVIREYVEAETSALRQELAAVKAQGARGIASAVIDRDNSLVLTYTDGTTQSLGVVVGKDGDAGATFTLDDFIIDHTDERVIELKFRRGDVMHSFELEFPFPIYRGVWVEGRYSKGDLVTWGGSMWHAEKDTEAKPDGGEGDWKLAVKRGRDGKDAGK